MSNTQIYKNASYIPSKLQLKAPKLLTQSSEKPKNKPKNEFKFQISEIPKLEITQKNKIQNSSF